MSFWRKSIMSYQCLSSKNCGAILFAGEPAG
ncbi:MAG: hypothetical protein Ct9H300mP1_06570 [Planctomycetaceae bacterium]|nr:MAG: hypothetical protein Ct9H300mP1_06570 [Planctomycetaceae bacterium]